MTELEKMPAWKALKKHYGQMQDVHMRDLFSDDSQRFERYSLQLGELLLDFSKNRINNETLQLLFALARESELPAWMIRQRRHCVNILRDIPVSFLPFIIFLPASFGGICPLILTYLYLVMILPTGKLSFLWWNSQECVVFMVVHL